MIPALTLLVLVVAAFAAGRWGRPGAAVLALVSLVWLTQNKRLEGAVLLSLTEDHGIAATDLVAVAGLIAAVWAWRRPPQRIPNPSDS